MAVRLLTGINYVTDEAIHARIVAGENVPEDERHETRAEAGDLLFALPAHVLAALTAGVEYEVVPDGAAMAATTLPDDDDAALSQWAV